MSGLAHALDICHTMAPKADGLASRYTRIIKMLTLVHELVRTARTAPQRDIYYQLKSAPLFTSPRQVSDALEVDASHWQAFSHLLCHALSLTSIPSNLPEVECISLWKNC